MRFLNARSISLKAFQLSFLIFFISIVLETFDTSLCIELSLEQAEHMPQRMQATLQFLCVQTPLSQT